VLWTAAERVIPDIRRRTEMSFVGTPLTHQRFLRRHNGSYGPAIKAGEALFPGAAAARRAAGGSARGWGAACSLSTPVAAAPSAAAALARANPLCTPPSGPTTPIPGLYATGDSTFPGIGLPAVAASGAVAANTLVPLGEHLKLLKELGL
jgi:phytoene dehydrogenase-like protein